MKPSTTDVNAALSAIEADTRDPDHPRRLAAEAIHRYRRGSAIKRGYDFSAAPVELRQIFYNGAVWFSYRRWWSRLLRG